MALDNGVEITWLGHGAVRVKTPDGKIILVDPFISGNPSTPEHERIQDRADVILVSHGHGDNLGETVEIAKRTGAKAFCIFEIAQWLQKKGVSNVVGMNIGGTADADGIKITMTPAWHSSSIADGDSLLPGGTACGFVVRLSNGFTIYFSGDTGVFLDMQLIGKLLEPDLAVLSIGDHFTMGPKGAAEAVRLLGVKQVIPVHYGTFPALTGSPDALREETLDIDGLQIHALKPGETLS